MMDGSIFWQIISLRQLRNWSNFGLFGEAEMMEQGTGMVKLELFIIIANGAIDQFLNMLFVKGPCAFVSVTKLNGFGNNAATLIQFLHLHSHCFLSYILRLLWFNHINQTADTLHQFKFFILHFDLKGFFVRVFLRQRVIHSALFEDRYGIRDLALKIVELLGRQEREKELSLLERDNFCLQNLFES